MPSARTVLFTLLVLTAGIALAQSGGGFGGSAPSAPPGDLGGGDFGGGGFGGGFPGGGFGYSPFYSTGGGGGFIGVLVFFLVIFIILQFMRRSLTVGPTTRHANTSHAVKVQLLLSEGDEVKRALRDIARTGDPDTNEGLTRMLTEAALVALRHPERWTYGTTERTTGPATQTTAQVGTWATQARAAFTQQTTSHYQNQNTTSAYQHRADYQAQHGGLYLALTLAVAARELPTLPSTPDTPTNTARQALLAMTGVQPHQLLRAEVVWSPDAEGEFLTEDQAILKYPQLTKL